MKNNETILRPLSLLLCAALLAGCGQQGQTAGSSAAGPATSTASVTVDATYNAATAVRISLADGGSTAVGSGVRIDGNVVTITDGGDYLLSGSLSDGRVVVDAGKTDAVRLILDGVTIHCATSAPLFIAQAGKATVILADSSQNTLTDTADYQFAQGEDEPFAPLFSKDDLLLCGTGALTVQGNYKNGITSKDNLTIDGGVYTITAVDDAIRGKDSVTIADGSFTIRATCDGIQSNNDTEAGKGTVTITGGSFTIVAGNDAIQAETALEITGGSFDLTTGGGAAASTKGRAQAGFGGGMGGGMRGDRAGGMTPPDGMTPPGVTTPSEGTSARTDAAGAPVPVSASDDDAAEEAETSDSQKGIKAGGTLAIRGGDFRFDTQDDAVHSNGDVLIAGGSFAIATGDDGFHADGSLTVEQGDIDITTCYEGLEGTTVDILGGSIALVASDDGVNAADAAATGQNRPGQGNSNCYIRIAGGTLTVQASGDGLDSNGDLRLEGGVVAVHCKSGGADSALDCDGAMIYTGGSFAAAGSSGMAMAPGGDSTGCTLMVYFTQNQPAGSVVTLTDANGSEVLRFEAVHPFGNFVVGDPALQQGESYTLLLDGEKLADVTLTETTTRISQDGTAMTGGGMGGMRGERAERTERTDRAQGGAPGAQIAQNAQTA